MSQEPTAIDLGPKLPHVLVREIPLGGQFGGYWVECNGCGRSTAAYLEAHIKPDPGCVAREVERHRSCGKAEGG